MAVVGDDVLVVGNVGDSRAVLSRRTGAGAPGGGAEQDGVVVEQREVLEDEHLKARQRRGDGAEPRGHAVEVVGVEQEAAERVVAVRVEDTAASQTERETTAQCFAECCAPSIITFGTFPVLWTAV